MYATSNVICTIKSKANKCNVLSSRHILIQGLEILHRNKQKYSLKVTKYRKRHKYNVDNQHKMHRKNKR
jgi:hypothetical protein